jgi:hypothetical protein
MSAFALRIAHAWADQLGVSQDAVEWVAVKGACRTPVSNPGAAIHRLENGLGIAFVLGGAGRMDLLFVVTQKRVGYSVSLSHLAMPGDPCERYDVRPDYVGDLKHLVAAAKKYVRKVERYAPTHGLSAHELSSQHTE